MRRQHKLPHWLFLALGFLACMSLGAQAHPHAMARLAVPNGSHGIDFDDLGYSSTLHRILVPAAQTGALILVNPASDKLRVFRHIVPSGAGPAHDDPGTTSADYGEGLLFASDHADQAIVAISPASGHVVARASLASGSDFVRYVAPLHEVWVTEPRIHRIQRFSVIVGMHPALRNAGGFSVPGGPEALVIDTTHRVAYTNDRHSHTVKIALHNPRILATWPNTCTGSRGLAFAPAQQLLFVACREGKIAALDIAAGGKVVSTAKVGAGVDLIAWNAHLQHLYVPSRTTATLSVLKLEHNDRLQRIATAPVTTHSHCVATDGKRHAFVCAPRDGALLVYTDNN